MKQISRVVILGLLLVVTSAVGVRSQPTITETNSATLSHSGRLSIQGSGFGVARGQVLVAGAPALVSTWKDDRIVAYVPEVAPVGATSIVVESAATQQSNAVPLEVTRRQAEGRVDWVFEIDSEVIYYRPALAPDGTIYVHGYTYEQGGEGKVYALAPDGALKWITEVNWAADVPPAAGPDGAVYVGSIGTFTRISATGEVEWTYQGSHIQSGAAIGPDGTVYVGFELDPEVVALEPLTGEVVWETSPGLSAFGTGGNEARLGASTPDGPIDRLYLWWDALAAFDLDGDHLFTTSAGNIYDHEVAIGSDGTLYAPAQWDDDLGALNPFDGTMEWIAEGPWNVVSSDAEIGTDDMLYFVGNSDELNAFDPHTQTSVWHRNLGHYLWRPSLSPDGRTLLTSGGGTCNDPSGCTISFVKAIDPTDGSELWHLDLDPVWDPDNRSWTWDHARITPDSKTAYFTGWIAGNYDYLDERSLLWSISLQDPEIFADDFESGDLSGWSQAIQ